MKDPQDIRQKYLNDMGLEISAAAYAGVLTPEFPFPIEVEHIVTVNGPRAGALEIHAGLDAGKLLKALSRDSAAVLRQFFPWSPAGDPVCYMFGKAVRVEAPWPDHLAEKEVRLFDLGFFPRSGTRRHSASGRNDGVQRGRWIAGQAETGQTITLGLNNSTPTFLVGGTTGSGKSTFFHVLVAQLGLRPDLHQIVLLDAKYGDGLRVVSRMPGVVGPMATSLEEARAALCWVLNEMKGRYEKFETEQARREAGIPLLVVIIDEFQEFTDGAMKDKMMTAMMKKVAQQGRAALVHLVIGTHHPVQKVFGDQVTRQLLVGRVAFKVTNLDASRVLIGAAKPRADVLAGKGDAYFITPIGVQRVQGAWLPPEDLASLPSGGPTMEEWPMTDPTALDANLPPESKVQWGYEGAEMGIALVQAHLDGGRTKLIKALRRGGFSAGAVRATRLQDLARAAYRWMRENNWSIHQAEEGAAPPSLPPVEDGHTLDEWVGGLLGNPDSPDGELAQSPGCGIMEVHKHEEVQDD